MTSDYWESVLNDEHIVQSPSWAEVDEAVSRLDGKVHTLVTLDGEDGSTLFIGGSLEGMVVAWSRQDQNLIARRGAGDEKVQIVVGGQVGDYARRNVLPIQIAKNIAKAYADGLRVQDLFKWDQV
jgi:hypothetical protein